MMTEKLNLDSDNDPPKLYLDGDIYPFAWNRVTATEPPDTSGLPSLDHTLYLFHIVRFHLNRTYRFFDEDYFVTQLHKFYKSRSDEEATEPRFWFVQFLLVLALGNAFLSRPRNRTDPPGSKYFARAMAIMPNHTSTGKDSLLAIEVSALAGLYLYAIDHREAAHVQVSKSRTAVSSCANIDARSVMRYASHSWKVCTRSSLRKTLELRRWRGVEICGGPCISWIGTFLRRWGSQ